MLDNVCLNRAFIARQVACGISISSIRVGLAFRRACGTPSRSKWSMCFVELTVSQASRAQYDSRRRQYPKLISPGNVGAALRDHDDTVEQPAATTSNPH
jgi:hypothetical protein